MCHTKFKPVVWARRGTLPVNCVVSRIIRFTLLMRHTVLIEIDNIDVSHYVKWHYWRVTQS